MNTKNNFLLTFIFLISAIVHGQCPPDSFTIGSQEDVDNFMINYPDCTMYQGFLTVGGSLGQDITDLSGLSNLESIAGGLAIVNTQLTDLLSLGGVKMEGFSENAEPAILIISNNSLTSLAGLLDATIDFETITFYLEIRDNQSLTSFEGLHDLKKIDIFDIQNNDLITDFSSLIQLTEINNRYSVIGNENLTSLEFINPNFVFTGNQVFVEENPLLTSLEGLESTLNLTSLRVVGNSNLITLAGIENVDGLNVLELIDNPVLNSFGSIQNLDYQESNTIISLNLINNPQIMTLTGLFATDVEIEASFSTTIQEMNGLINLNGLEVLTGLSGNLIIKNNNALENIDGFSNATGDIRRLRIENNPSLTSINGLANLTEFNGIVGTSNQDRLIIDTNNSLVSLSGLENLTSMSTEDLNTEFYKIINNDVLTDISALTNFNFEDIYDLNLQIEGNESLSQCSIDSVCEVLNSTGMSMLTIGGNATGCMNEIEVAASCVTCPSNDIVLTSQGEVDNFTTTYPNCTTITGNLMISGDNITNLQGLSQIETITGSLNIRLNPNLTSLDGLGPLNFVNENSDIRIFNNGMLSDIESLTGTTLNEGRLYILDNPLITSLTAFSSVTNLILLEIRGCDVLTCLEGLEGTTDLFSLIIQSNDSLTDISALSTDSGALGVLEIRTNPNLVSLAGLEGYDEITFGALIFLNDSLENLDALSGLVNQNTAPMSVSFEISNNDMLTDISGLSNLNSNSINQWEIFDNPLLSECNILSVCNFLTNNGNIIINNNASGCNSNAEVLDACNITFNTISGNVLFDFNNNGCTTGDFSFSSALVEITDGTDIVRTLTDENGFYNLFITMDGIITTKVLETSLPENFTANPAEVFSEFTGFGNEEEIDFCITSIDVFNDLKVTFLPIDEARPGFDAHYQIIYENVGTTILSGNVTLTFDDNRQLFLEASPVQNDIQGNILTFNFENMLPFQSSVIEVFFNNFAPPINNSDDILNFTATINPIENDNSQDDNIAEVMQVMVNSFDPNDKQVVQGTQILEDQIGEYLSYIVRFQNTGTADAINVRVEDVLSENLDWNTIRVLSSSDDFELQITNENMISFNFYDIFLPPQQVDEEGSNGYIAFQVKSKNDLIVGDNVQNTASIFFDFNAPIITNTVITTVVEEILSVKDITLEKEINVSPNPVSEKLKIEVTNGMQVKQVNVYSILGELLFVSSETELNFSNMATGIYFVTIETNRGEIVIKRVIKK